MPGYVAIVSQRFLPDLFQLVIRLLSLQLHTIYDSRRRQSLNKPQKQ
jgi:hypothetical protein